MDEPIVNFGDPQSIRDALPLVDGRIHAVKQARDRAAMDVQEAQRRVEDAAREAERWILLHNTLMQYAVAFGLDLGRPEIDGAVEIGGPSIKSDDVEDEDSKAQTLAVVESDVAAWTVASVAAKLPIFKRKTVSWALWSLAEDKLIQRLGRGVYASHAYQPQELLSDPAVAGSSSTREAV